MKIKDLKYAINLLDDNTEIYVGDTKDIPFSILYTNSTRRPMYDIKRDIIWQSHPYGKVTAIRLQ